MRTIPFDEDIPASQRPVKIKLGGADNYRILRRLNGVKGPILLDVNRAWSPAEWQRLQPLVAEVAPAALEDPVSDPDLLPEIRAALPDTAVIFDEEVTSLTDIEQAVVNADGANIKLMRFGGLLPAIEALKFLRSAGAATMLGCYLVLQRQVDI